MALRFLKPGLSPVVGLVACLAITVGITILMLVLLPAGRSILWDLKHTALLLLATRQEPLARD
jgi:hypothetical protein